MFAVALVGVLLTVLWAPSWIALALFARLTTKQILRTSWVVWLIQAMAAIALIYLTDAIGLANPAGYTLGICVALGVSGAVILWWPRPRRHS